ncbi:hypothetical protein D5F01_LYC13440 [Larimichthys crocea]|uniref:Myb/SANT-like DNA-binding domain-containing protein n=1 Tax=Larimichthys crocea TaxID=215358 RepID=A0A6G0I7I8_LARCR|nr:hypothetical protein D5F01_LYC13440 [Larimichthys crocea]
MAATSPDGHKWSQAQTRRLIRFRADNEPRFLKSKASAKQQWQALISELELEGKVSSQQVSKKWENLKKRYKELKTGKFGAGTDAGEVTATNWQYYEDMHEVLGVRPCMDPPLLVDAGAEEEDIPTTMRSCARQVCVLLRAPCVCDRDRWPGVNAGDCLDSNPSSS